MYRSSSRQFNKDVVIIHPGEYFISSDNILIGTVLGSCISVALRDTKTGLCGLNHFMLPGMVLSDDTLYANQNARYGMYAMEVLINDMLKAGSSKQNLVAKVFGGASVLQLSESMNKIPLGNIDFAVNYLKTEKITILAQDTGGRQARKILFDVVSGSVFLKRFSGAKVHEVQSEEVSYLATIQEKAKKIGEVTFF